MAQMYSFRFKPRMVIRKHEDKATTAPAKRFEAGPLSPIGTRGSCPCRLAFVRAVSSGRSNDKHDRTQLLADNLYDYFMFFNNRSSDCLDRPDAVDDGCPETCSRCPWSMAVYKQEQLHGGSRTSQIRSVGTRPLQIR